MSSTGDDASDRSDDASDETGSVASSSDYDSEDEDSAEDSDDNSSDDGDASSEENDDEEDNQAKEVAEQKAKAVQDDVASILKMASSMDKICRRLQFKYGSNRKIALEPNPANDEVKDEVPEVLTPPKPTDVLPQAEPPRKVMSDAATDSNDLELPPKSVVTMDAGTEPAAPVTLTAINTEHLMRNIEVQGKPKPVVPHIEKDCQLQLALSTEPSLHLQEYMHPPPLLELPKRPRPFLATSATPLRALSSIHVPKLPSPPPRQDDAGDLSVPPDLSEITVGHSAPIQRTQTSKHDSRQEPSTDTTRRTDFGGQVDSPRRVVSDAATDSSDLEPIVTKAHFATAAPEVTKQLVDRGVATSESAPVQASSKDVESQPAAAKKRAAAGPPPVVHLQPERHASQHLATPRSTAPLVPTSVPTPRLASAALPWSALEPTTRHPETPAQTPARLGQAATSAEPANRSTLAPPSSVSKAASVGGEALELPAPAVSRDETMSNDRGKPATRPRSPTTSPAPAQQPGSEVMTPPTLFRTDTGTSAAQPSAANDLDGPTKRNTATMEQPRAPVIELPTKAKISPSSPLSSEPPATKSRGLMPNNTTPTPVASPEQPQTAPTSVAAPQERLFEETVAASPLQETEFTAADGNGDQGAPPETQVPAEEEEDPFFDHGGDEASMPDGVLLSATASPLDTVVTLPTETAPKASLPAIASDASGASAEPEMLLSTDGAEMPTKLPSASGQPEQLTDQQPMRRQSSAQPLSETLHLIDGEEPARASTSLVAQDLEVSPRIEAPAVQLQQTLAPDHERLPLRAASEVLPSAASSSKPLEVVPSTASSFELSAVSPTVPQAATGPPSVVLDQERSAPPTPQVAATPAALSQTATARVDAQPRPSSSTNVLPILELHDVSGSEPSPTLVAPAPTTSTAPAASMPAVLGSASPVAPAGATVEPAPSTNSSLQGLMASAPAGPTVYAASRATVPATPLAPASTATVAAAPIPASSSRSVDPASTSQPIVTARRRSSSVRTPETTNISQVEAQHLPQELSPDPNVNVPVSQDLSANVSMSKPVSQDLPPSSSIDPAKAYQNDTAPPTPKVEAAVRRPSILPINTTSTARRPSSIATSPMGLNTLEDTGPVAVDPLSPPAVTPPAASHPIWATPTPTPSSTSYNFQVFASTLTALPPSSLDRNASLKQPTSPLGSYSPPMPSPRTMSLAAKLPIEVEINAMHYLLFGSPKQAAP